MARERVMQAIRNALGRNIGQAPAPAPPPILSIPDWSLEQRITRFRATLEKLNGKVHRAASPEDARDYAASLLAGRAAIASNAPLLAECGITSIDGVTSGITDRAELREHCATAAAGISSADYALADTGSLVLFSSRQEARMISLLPPLHLAIVPVARLLTGLDELLTLVPAPATVSSSMVFITGPSRTADIEQILVRGVHGPGEIHVVLV